MKNKIEILSPAGSWESLKAAAVAGADAVYFGASSFNARKNAENFSDDDIANVVSFCHARGIKAFFALNTIIFEDEMKKALELAFKACRAGVDAIILQDIGLASLIRRAAPEARLHASTQMSVHNISGVEELAKLGFSRVVLEREISGNEMKKISEKSPVELEVFVHGAHCMSISGQCYMSAFFGGKRSGNRGLCAQPCRLPFYVGKFQNVLSLKDLSLIKYIKLLSNAGIFSAKIEGRMKRPEYVFAATNICRKAADGEIISNAEMEDLKSVFSRSGFTSGFYDKKIDAEMFGVRSLEDVKLTSSIIKRFRNSYKNGERQRIKVDFDLSIKKEQVKLTVIDNDSRRVDVFGEKPETVQKKELDVKKTAAMLSKTGGTPFFPGKVEVTIEKGVTVPVSEINKLRRDALNVLLEQRSRITPISFDTRIISRYATNFSTKKRETVEKLRLRFHSMNQAIGNIDYSKIEMIVFPLSEVMKKEIENFSKLGVKVAVELPRAIFSNEDEIKENLQRAKDSGIEDAVCGNIGAVNIAKKLGMNVHGDFGLNISNSASLEAYSEIGVKTSVLSFEMPIESIISTTAKEIMPCGVIIYGRLPLMLVRNCPVRSFRGCADGRCSITDRTNSCFPLVCGNGTAEILNSRPLWLFDEKERFKGSCIDFMEIYFTIEDKKEVKNVMDSFCKRLQSDGKFTRGLYFHRRN